MKRLLKFVFAAAMLLSGAAYAQEIESECRELLELAKKHYYEYGEEGTMQEFEMIDKLCSEEIKAEARAWLKEQKNKEAEAKRKKQEEERRKHEEEQARIEAENRKREQERLKQQQELARQEEERHKREEEQHSNRVLTQDVETITVNGVSFKMIRVNGGTFKMGATSEQGSDAYSNEKPVHSVTLSSYYIGQTEVTQELWQAVMGSNPSYFNGSTQLPVERVSWEDCQEFIEKLNKLTGKSFRLPTEAEWEFAARGGNKSRGYKYSGSNTVDNVTCYDDNSGNKTHTVATKQANELGLYDMSGNVWEWCADYYGSYSNSAQTNPKGPSSGRLHVLRGGGWFNRARNVRVSLRGDNTPSNRNGKYGLRLAL